ncbi:MAG: hypothetical protein V1861_04935 [Candidatus Micrarchaeota archaeon]
MAGRKIEDGRDAQVRGSLREKSSTLAFGTEELGLEGPTGAFPPTPARLLDMVKGKLSGCRIMRNESGIATTMNEDGTMPVYKTLPANIQGACMLNLGDKKFIVGRTRSTWVLIYDSPPEEIYEDTRFMNIDLKKRDILVLENGKTMFLSRISRQDIDMLNGIAAIAGGRKAPQSDTLAPSADGVVSYSGLQNKLRAATDICSGDPLFEMEEFVQGIKFVTTLQDQHGNSHYYIVSGKEEHDYYLYINSNSNPPERCIFTTTFTYKKDSCILYRED